MQENNYCEPRGQGYILPRSKTRLKLVARILCTDARLIELCVTTQRDTLMEQPQHAVYSLN